MFPGQPDMLLKHFSNKGVCHVRHQYLISLALTAILLYPLSSIADSGEKNLKEGKAFLEKNSKKKGVITTKSGLQYKIIKAGTGAKPKLGDKVTTHYKGTLINGQVFDSSYKRNAPATFPVNGVIKGWIEALQLMKVGAKWQLYIPSNLAYGSSGAGATIKANATLIFDIELLEIK